MVTRKLHLTLETFNLNSMVPRPKIFTMVVGSPGEIRIRVFGCSPVGRFLLLVEGIQSRLVAVLFWRHCYA